MQRPQLLCALGALAAANIAGSRPAQAVTPTPHNLRALPRPNQRIVAYDVNLPNSDTNAFVQMFVSETPATIEAGGGIFANTSPPLPRSTWRAHRATRHPCANP